MVDKFKEVLAKIHEADKQVSLFAVLKMDEITDRWSIIFSAPGLEDEKKRRDTFVYLVDLLPKTLTKKEAEAIARVGVFALNNHLVENLLKYKTGFEIKESTPVNGNVVHEGYVLESIDL